MSATLSSPRGCVDIHRSGNECTPYTPLSAKADLKVLQLLVRIIHLHLYPLHLEKLPALPSHHSQSVNGLSTCNLQITSTT